LFLGQKLKGDIFGLSQRFAFTLRLVHKLYGFLFKTHTAPGRPFAGQKRIFSILCQFNDFRGLAGKVSLRGRKIDKAKTAIHHFGKDFMAFYNGFSLENVFRSPPQGFFYQSHTHVRLVLQSFNGGLYRAVFHVFKFGKCSR
jgi:hypothetical protein